MWLDEITDKAKITNTSINDSEYAPALNGDNEFSNNKRAVEGEEWMTLSYSEWDYLIKTRTNASNLYGVAKVNGVKGLILLPDEWIDPKPDDKEFNSGLANSTVNEYTAAQWSVMEASGAVFFPAAGCCDRASHSAIGFGGGNSWGDYWTSTAMDKNNARYLTFTLGQVVWNDFKHNRNIRRSARLVRPL